MTLSRASKQPSRVSQPGRLWHRCVDELGHSPLSWASTSEKLHGRESGFVGGIAPYQPSLRSVGRIRSAQVQGSIAGRHTELLVLATPHLSGFPKTFDPKHLGPLLDRLTKWKPRIITIESLSGPQCEFLARYKARYGSTADDYCWNPAPAEKATGLNVVAATAEVDRLLASWPTNPTATQRRHLAASFLSAGDQSSALVQWLRLPQSERHAGDGVDATLAARLDTLRTKPNENFLIAAALAARLGLERVHPTDDHTADPSISNDPGYGKALQRIWDTPVVKKRLADEAELERGVSSGEGVLRLYRYYNQPSQAQIVFDSDFGAALRDGSPQFYGRHYAAWWETRNLRMAANIRAAAATQPGARVLSIVGASHKGYFEAYLGMMHDIRIADAPAMLR